MKLTTHIDLEPPVKLESAVGSEPPLDFNLSAQVRPHVG
jgi:hypothetical protein